MTKTTYPTIRIHNAETNEIIDRQMTAEEFAAYDAANKIQIERALNLEANIVAE